MQGRRVWLVAGLFKTGSVVVALALVLLCSAGHAALVYVANPGTDRDIKPALESAILSATPGDTIILPKGSFKFIGRISVTAKPLTIRGQGKNKTRLYRSVDSTLSMMQFVGSGDQSQLNIEISDIWFQGMQPSRSYGDGLSQTVDMGIVFYYCNPRVHHCRFQYFGTVAVSVIHRDAAGTGLVCDNEFLDNYKLIDPDVNTTGYGVCTGGEEKQWITDAHPGSGNFVFVEGNYFEKHRHAIASGGGGLYVFRHNRVMENRLSHAIDAHGVDSNNPISTRCYEIYNNDVLNYDVLGWYAIGLRGGEGVIFNNFVGSANGYRVGVMLIESQTTAYPAYTQIGWASGAVYGALHTGTDPATFGKGDVYIWGNDITVRDASISVYPNHEALLVAERDFHTGVVRPGYTSYIYPHPLRPAGFNYVLTGDVDADQDDDGLSMLQEFFHSTNPSDPDTDDDSMNDGYEVDAGRDPTEAAGAVSGVIRDTRNNPVSGASVSLGPIFASVVSGPDGAYVFTDVEEGSYSISVSRDGYVPRVYSQVVVLSNKSTRCDFILKRNLLFNGGFEDGAPLINGQHNQTGVQYGWTYVFPGEWSYLAPESLATLTAPRETHSGIEASRHACYSLSPAGGTRIYQDVEVNPGTSYTASVWVKAVDKNGAGFGANPTDTAGFSIQEYAAGMGTFIAAYPKVQITGPTEYVRLSRTFSTTADTRYVRFILDTVAGCNRAYGWATYDNCVLEGPTVDESLLTVSQVKGLPDTSDVYLENKVVTATYDNCFYVEEQDRSSGIKVTGTARVGDMVDVAGRVLVTGGEAALVSDAIVRRPGGTVPAPLGVRHRDAAGDLSPVGLYVVMWGRVGSVNEAGGFFTMTDGSAESIKVYGTAEAGGYVRVIGALGAEAQEVQVIPVLRSVVVTGLD